MFAIIHLLATFIADLFKPRPLAGKTAGLGPSDRRHLRRALGAPRRTVMVEFTLRHGNWTADWTPQEAVMG
jgi:hypothetical protein